MCIGSWLSDATTPSTWDSRRPASAAKVSSPARRGSAFCSRRVSADTIRVSLTPAPGGDRAEEVRVAQQVLESLGLRSFTPQVTVPRLRPNHQHVLSADGAGNPGPSSRANAGVAQ